jgi:hypothetical protein
MSAMRFGFGTGMARWGALVFAAVAVDAVADGLGAQCDYTEDAYRPRTYAQLDTNKYGKCIKRRDFDVGGALTLTDRSEFATRCPVVVKLNTHETKCKPVPSALREDDVLRINEWPDSRFELSLMRVGRPVFPAQFLEPFKIRLNDESIERTIGYYADVRLPFDPAWPDRPVDVRYIVYLSSAKIATKMVKYYSVEVFERSELCVAEEPSARISGKQPCTTLDLGIPPQLPSGGGGEPPPKN